jgi:catechol 2,3-dioxygenase-like lactoylglutathione lyase family enzyme
MELTTEPLSGLSGDGPYDGRMDGTAPTTGDMSPPGVVPPAIVNVHHVRLPVSDVLASRDWYIETLGFQPLLVEEDESGVTGIALQHPCGVVIGLHRDAARASALRGFVAVAFGVADLGEWVDFLRSRKLSHAPPADTHLGHSVRLTDPDGIIVELHTHSQPSATDA